MGEIVELGYVLGCHGLWIIFSNLQILIFSQCWLALKLSGNWCLFIIWCSPWATSTEKSHRGPFNYPMVPIWFIVVILVIFVFIRLRSSSNSSCQIFSIMVLFSSSITWIWSRMKLCSMQHTSTIDTWTLKSYQGAVFKMEKWFLSNPNALSTTLRAWKCLLLNNSLGFRGVLPLWSLKWYLIARYGARKPCVFVNPASTW